MGPWELVSRKAGAFLGNSPSICWSEVVVRKRKVVEAVGSPRVLPKPEMATQTHSARSRYYRRGRKEVHTGAVALRNSRGPYYIQVSSVCYSYYFPLTISQPECPRKFSNKKIQIPVG
jgi:hypothetical protein